MPWTRVETECSSVAAIRARHHNSELDVNRLPDDVTFNDLQPRMLCTVCDHRGSEVSRHGCIMADGSPEIADPLVHAHVGLLQLTYKRFLLGGDLCGKRCSDSFVQHQQLVDRH
jgi:hypothetical protein